MDNLWQVRRDRIVSALTEVCANANNYSTEAILQESLAAKLLDSLRELTAIFSTPPIAAKTPSPDEVKICVDKGRKITEAGKDPCDGRQRKIDILWEGIPIELKSVTTLKSDVYGYQFLKDIHRMERLKALEGADEISKYRLCIFVASDPAIWKKIEGYKAPQVYDGMVAESGHWVQYQQKSPVTRWYDYPPFYLLGNYKIEWKPLPHEARYLMVEVGPH